MGREGFHYENPGLFFSKPAFFPFFFFFFFFELIFIVKIFYCTLKFSFDSADFEKKVFIQI